MNGFGWYKMKRFGDETNDRLHRLERVVSVLKDLNNARCKQDKELISVLEKRLSKLDAYYAARKNEAP